MTNLFDRRAALGAFTGVAAMLAGPRAAPGAAAPTSPDAPAIVTAEQLADMDFVAWEHEPDEWTPPSNEEWLRLSEQQIISFRFAWLIMHKTKPELETVARNLEDETFIELVNAIGSARECFTDLASILESAECRMMSAAASALRKDDQAEFAEA
jgi:hypothetical protein